MKTCVFRIGGWFRIPVKYVNSKYLNKKPNFQSKFKIEEFYIIIGILTKNQAHNLESRFILDLITQNLDLSEI